MKIQSTENALLLMVHLSKLRNPGNAMLMLDISKNDLNAKIREAVNDNSIEENDEFLDYLFYALRQARHHGHLESVFDYFKQFFIWEEFRNLIDIVNKRDFPSLEKLQESNKKINEIIKNAAAQHKDKIILESFNSAQWTREEKCPKCNNIRRIDSGTKNNICKKCNYDKLYPSNN